MTRSTMQRWAAKVRLPTEWKEEACWEWTACKWGGGYGTFYWNRRTGLAHRYAYERFVGPIPEGQDVYRVCHNPGCVNPEHLGLEPFGVNGFCADNARKTHCIHGHALAGDNLRVQITGHRSCATCIAATSARSHARRRADPVRWEAKLAADRELRARRSK